MDRFVLHTDAEELKEVFSLAENVDVPKKLTHYNIAPGIQVPIIIEPDEMREVVSASWGFISRESGNTINSIRQEDALEDSIIADLIQTQPCIIPANGFYKWKESVDDPLPFYLRVLNTDLSAIAGVYTTSVLEDGNLEYFFAALTMTANALVEPLDSSMPCILKEDQIDQWLKGDAPKLVSKGLTSQGLLPHMAVYRVHDLVNDKENNSPELIQPIPKLRDDDDD